jgi:hypothetical protein
MCDRDDQIRVEVELVVVVVQLADDLVGDRVGEAVRNRLSSSDVNAGNAIPVALTPRGRTLTSAVTGYAL